MRGEIGTKRKKRRKAHNLSQTAFAALIGASSGRVSNWEQGGNRPDSDKLSVACKTLGMRPTSCSASVSAKADLQA